MSDERIIFEGKIPFKVMHFSHHWIWMVLLGWNIGVLISWIQSKNQAIKITSERIILTHGILSLLSKTEENIEYYRVRDIKLQQTLFQRIVRTGTITLFSDDATAPIVAFSINKPQQYRDQIRERAKIERKRMGTIQLD